ncbi:type II secretion system protein F [Methanocella sp. CWC-04]|uniref:Type II secretion system protein F n=2 Tax=Methanooceanicella nereidis TaxID=2052831 RepID=A0AAP2W724_9EURY|nr:type II secretion system protein F [Methanocella sp. CWC-04]
MDGFMSCYEKCRIDMTCPEYVYRTLLLSIGVPIAVIISAIAVALPGMIPGPLTAIYSIPAGIFGGAITFYARVYSIRSLKNYRGALMDAKAVHSVGFMLTMAESNVPLKRMFQNLSNLGTVYGEDIALESTYIISLAEEDGMDIISAVSKAQSVSPSVIWQEILIGISGVYSSGGELKEYLKGKYQTLSERKRTDVRKYNDTVQGLSSVYLSVIGIAAIFIALINLVFNMASLFSNDSLVWLDALIIVPIGSFVIMRILKVTNPEA